MSDRIIGQFAVVVRLDVSAWQGRQARIYKRLPPQAGAPVTARWRSSRGVLLEGAVRDGERTLVYSGPITTPRIEDTLTVVLAADGGRATRAQTLDFGFEIERHGFSRCCRSQSATARGAAYLALRTVLPPCRAATMA